MHSSENPITRGRFITLEGIDGAGKSSHTEVIQAWIQAKGHTCIHTREPGGTPLGEQLREMVLHKDMHSMTELLLVFAARAEHIHQVIEPALAKGIWVISDRFTDATRAYQGGGRQMGLTHINALANMVHAQCQPDLTLIFDISPEDAAKRVQGRGKPDRFESEKASFTARVRAAYLDQIAGEPERCKRIDGSQSIENVRYNVLAILASQFSKDSNV